MFIPGRVYTGPVIVPAAKNGFRRVVRLFANRGEDIKAALKLNALCRSQNHKLGQ